MLRRLALQTLQTAAARQLISTLCNCVAPREAPWFEQPDADKLVDRLRSRAEIDDVDTERLRQWTRDGYFVVRNAVPASDIDEIGALMDGLASARRPITGVKLLGLREPGQAAIMDLSHREFLRRYALEDRVRMLSESPWRIHGLHRWHSSVRRVFRNQELLRFASLIFQHRAVASWSITFARGSGQPLHQDMAVFHVQPRGFLIGCWIACEDIAADSGPLIYCPGSHRSEWFPEFNKYPQTNLRTATYNATQRYHDWIVRESRRFEQKRFLASKGDVLFWHSMLFHGGDAIQRSDATRRSLVIHYRVRGTDRAWTVSGPFNW
jgi:ectoine hydroxylase-related dioxygenase (phytanoyl-CoA dioxygenase family)